jgi:Na+/proline symporter/signal transduction histidine kinase/CheY-like chemotaxis protein
MLTPEWIIFFSLIYLGFLFWIARRGDRGNTNPRWQPTIYALSMGTYCTSWSFYGTVEQFSHTGWWISPLHVGVILLFLLGWRFLDRLIRTGKMENATTVADFVAARYGHARVIAVLIAVISLIGIVPYIALQLKAVSISFSLLSSTQTTGTIWWQDQALYVALIMAVFSIMFGTRYIDTSEHQKGLIQVIAFESIVKLVVLLVLGFFAVEVVFSGFSDVLQSALKIPRVKQVLTQFDSTYVYLVHMMLGLFSIFCLPRQFHVLVVENQSAKDLLTARWMFPLYLVLINLVVQPIALAGQLYFGVDHPDKAYFSLMLPLQEGNEWLALFAYIGGLSAGTSMVIIATIALSSMASNELLMPLAIKLGLMKPDSATLGRNILTLRRISIVVILITAYAYSHLLARYTELVAIGMLSMVAVAQFAPAILLGLWWDKLNRRGAFIGLSLGFAIWAYTLVVPVMAQAGILSSDIMQGPFGISMLQPQALFGLNGLDPIVHGTVWSLLVNVFGLVLGSIGYREKFVDQVQAARFVENESPAARPSHPETFITIGDIRSLLERFVREDKTHALLKDYTNPQTGRLLSDQPANSHVLQRTERLLGSVIGTPAARLMLNSILHAQQTPLGGNLTTIVDEASHMLHFSREILNSALQSIDQGISIVDRDLNIVAWNMQYQNFFPCPEGLLQVGQPVSKLLRYWVEQGEFDTGNIEESISRRLSHLASGKPYHSERRRPNGQILEIKGNPMPDGGYITTFTDITQQRLYEQQLQQTNEMLEEKVGERTRELTLLNDELKRANTNKTRFLAAAGHDLVQPLNSAALFTSSLIHKMERQEVKPDLIDTASQLEQSLESAETLLSELLEISKLDSDVVHAKISRVELKSFLESLQAEFSVVAEEKGLLFHVACPYIDVESDSAMLRRILQNLLSNAFRYTPHGSVSLSVLPHTDHLLILVQDTGIGIEADKISCIFDEFLRLPNQLPQQDKGLGLGLAIVNRMCKLLNHRIKVESTLGEGSCFSIELPLLSRQPEPPPGAPLEQTSGEPQGQLILCIDNEEQILEGMASLLEDWGYTVITAVDLQQATSKTGKQTPDLYIVDYYLDNGVTGMEVLAELEGDGNTPAIVITADYTEDVAVEVQQSGYALLKKPVKPLALRSLIMSTINQTRLKTGYKPPPECGS